jgi:stress response protein SCP2
MFTNAVADQMNEIFFRRKQQILDIDLREGVCGAAVLATGLRNLECLGYMFRREDIERLRNSDEDTVASCLNSAARAVKTVLVNDPEYDGKLQYSPMYPGFPKQVMEASAAELFINAMLHYMTDGRYMPDSAMTEHTSRKAGVFKPKHLKMLTLGSLDDFKEMFRLLMNAASSISETDEEDLRFFFHNFEDSADYIPVKPAFKENSAILANLCITERGISLEQYAERHAEDFRNPTDVLRLAAVLSGGDASLAENPRFTHFVRADRKALLRLLEGCTCLLENMARRRETWLRLGEALHPGDYPRFAKVNAAYMKLRGGDIPMAFAGQFNAACEDGDFATALQLMSRRPGEFARAIDMMLRRASDTTPILDAFEAVAEKVATRVLLQLREHFVYRSSENLQPLPASMTPEERKAWRLAELKRMQEEIEKEIAEALQQNDREMAEWQNQLEVLQGKIAKTKADIQQLEDEDAQLSEKAIRESTFDKMKIKRELEQKSESDDAFTQSLVDLAIFLTNHAGLKCTDENCVSSLKFRGHSKRSAGKFKSAYSLLAGFEDQEYQLQELIAGNEETRQRIADNIRKLRQRKKREGRNFGDGAPIRVFFPKGSMAKSYVILDKLPGVPRETSRRMVEICENALVKQYAKRERLGKVWVSELFSQYLVPFSQRSASKALRTVVRGSRSPWAPETKVIRGFIWWKNSEHGRTDIDLSAMMLDEDWKYVEHVSFTNLRSPVTGSCHSGDIVDAPHGAAEYIDIDIAKAKAAGVRYVAFNIYGFTWQPFCDLPECSFGWMEREDAEGGQIFEAATVRNKIDLSCNSKIALPVIFDLEEGVAIWMDMALKEQLSCIALENNAQGVIAVCRALVEMHKPNLYDLVQLHIRARGEQVDDKSKADVVFDVDDGITPYDVEEWMANYI